jgi:DNA polymerase I-like protein with 3'-5' exonuclease and polymerase domains
MPDIITLQTDTDLFGQDVAAGPSIERDTLATGLYHQLKDITLEEFCSYFVNGFEAMVSYANLCAGEKDGQRISLLFNPHRLDTGTKRFPISLYQALKDERFVRGLARVVILNKKKGATKDLLYASVGMGVQGTSYVQEFPPHVARDLALEYNLSKSSKVLDPCAGWGGRMLGFSAVVDSYTCCEPSTRTAAGLRKLLDFIKAFRSDFSATIHEAPFEDVILPRQHFDFAMTSPPYYDTEHYAPGEVANSFNRYATFEQWCTGFYAPLIHRTMAALKPGACFVINIGSRIYPLNDKLFAIANEHYAVEKQKGRLSASNGLGKEGEGETFYEVKNPAGTIVVVEPSDAQSVNILTLEPLAVTETVEPQAEPALSALDFALQPREPELLASMSETQPAAATQTVIPVVARVLTIAEIIAELTRANHRLLTKDGKLFVSNASLLSDAHRALLKERKAELLPYAESYDTPAVTVATSLADFLGTVPIRRESTWRAEAPPSLDGIDNIVLNFETNGLDWVNGDKPIGVTVGTLDGQFRRFLPFGFQDGNLDEAQVKVWAQRELRNKHITNTNTRFDVHMARVWGVDLEAQGNTVSDVQHYAALLDDQRKRFAIDVLAEDYLGGIKVARMDERNMSQYTAADVAERAEYQVQLVAELRNVMWPLLDKEELQTVRKLEDDVIYPIVEMEKNGSKIDVELMEQYFLDCSIRHDKLILEISQDVGFGFDHTNTGWKRLFEHFKLPPSASYAEDVVGVINHPIIQKAHLASQLASLNSKTFAAYRKNIDSHGILRYDINQLRNDEGGTVTGRLSIGYIQQVPNHDNHHDVFGAGPTDECHGLCDLFPRRVFIAEHGEYLEADAAQIEYRYFVHFGNILEVIKAYQKDPMMSFHKKVWEMFKVIKPDMLYTHQKRFNFAKQYGARTIKLASMMGFITTDEGDEIRARKAWNDPRLKSTAEIEAIYKKVLPEGDELLARAMHLAKSYCDDYCHKGDALHRQFKHRGYVKTILGRRSRFPDNYRAHKALNCVLQGSGADHMKTKLVELHKARKDTALLMRMTAHDSVGGDAQERTATLTRVRSVLNEQTIKVNVPIVWECGTGPNWAEAK